MSNKPQFIIDSKKPVIAGLISAIYETKGASSWEATRRSGIWETLRALWQSKALTFEEFKWLEALSAILVEETLAATHGCIPIPNCAGWEKMVALADERFERGERFEEIREKRGLQAAFDEVITSKPAPIIVDGFARKQAEEVASEEEFGVSGGEHDVVKQAIAGEGDEE